MTPEWPCPSSSRRYPTHKQMVCDFALRPTKGESILPPLSHAAMAFSWQIDRLRAVELGVKIMDSNKLRLFIGLIQSAEVRCRSEHADQIVFVCTRLPIIKKGTTNT